MSPSLPTHPKGRVVGMGADDYYYLTIYRAVAVFRRAIMPVHVSEGFTYARNSGTASSKKPRGPSPTARVTVEKVDASTVPYGDSISRNGRTVWVGRDPAQPGRVVCVCATAEEARRRTVDILWAEQSARAEQRREAELAERIKGEQS
jgi:hypothetical protein